MRKPATKDDFVNASNKVHTPGQYSYQDTIYVHSHTKLDVFCNIHQKKFSIRPFAHIKGQGCPDCGVLKRIKTRTLTQEEYVERCNKRHGYIYGYDRLIYKGSLERVEIYCKHHGEYFFQWAPNHLKGAGCPKCSYEKSRIEQLWSNEEYIEKATKTHGHDYSYHEVQYSGVFNKVKIFCKSHNGYFEQVASRHLQGHGCPICKESSGERNVRRCLESLGVKYIQEYRMPQERRFLYDFYLPDYGIYIEFHGQQHYSYLPFFYKSKKEYKLRKLQDKIKVQLVELWGGKILILHYSLNTEEKVRSFLLSEFNRLNLPIQPDQKG